MATINQLCTLSADDVAGGLQFPTWVSEQGGTYRVSLTNLATWLASHMTSMATDSLTATSFVGITACLVSELPSAVTSGAGARATVTDGAASSFYTVLAGGGANIVPCFSDGTQWRIG